MPDALRPYFSRIAASLIALVVTWLAARGVTLVDSTQTELRTLVETTLYLIVYAISHRTIDKSTNPPDSASSHLAVEGKLRVDRIKSDEKVSKGAQR
jgi:hypothetical protein